MSRLKQLDSARGLAAVVVVAYHAVYTIDIGAWQVNSYFSFFEKLIFLPAKFGEAAVYFFMCISGFVLAMMVQKNPFLNKRQWMIWRSIRLIPLYYLSLLSAVFVSSFIGTQTYFYGVYFSHFYLFSNSTIYSGANPPLWSLTVEILLSLFFFLILKLERYFASRILLVTSIMYAFTYLLDGWGLRALVRSLIFFTIGISICHGAKIWSNRRKLLTSLIFINLLISYIDLPRNREIITLLQFLVIPLLFSHITQSDSKNLLTSKILSHLGRISFTMYVFHWPILQILQIEGTNSQYFFLQNKIVAVPSVILIVILISTLIYFLLERNIMYLSKYYIKVLKRS